MPGFDVRLCFFDPMHTIFLGTARDLIPSCIGHWFRSGQLRSFLGDGVLAHQLRVLSARAKAACPSAGSFKAFTPANTGLDKPSEYPELGSAFKASTVKALIWFFASMAAQIADANPDSMQTIVFGKRFCLFHLIRPITFV